MGGFQSGTLKEDFLFNANETHFVVDWNDGRTLAVKGDREVKYINVASGQVGMIMMVMLGGGSNVHFEVPLIIFQNDCCTYPTQVVLDIVPGVRYRSGSEGSMDAPRV